MTTFSSVRRQLTGRTYSAGSTAPAVATKLVRRSSTLQNAEATRRPAVAFFGGQEGWPESHGPDPQMSLDVIDRHSEALFEFLVSGLRARGVQPHPLRGRVLQALQHTGGTPRTARGPWLRGSCPRLLRYRHDLESPRRRKLRRDLPDGSARVKILGAPGDYGSTGGVPNPAGLGTGQAR